MNIESLAVTEVKSTISKTDYLVEAINENDKEPSWDGCIYVYDKPSNNHRKEDFKATVPVQVKGTIQKIILHEKIRFRVSVVDLENYRKVGGTLFFVVYVSQDGENKKIYYNSLLPFELNRILKSAGSKKSVQVEFIPFPTDKNEITNIVINIANDMKKQTLLRNGEYDMERAAKDFNLSKFKYGFSYSSLGYSYKDSPNYLLNHDLYLYAQNEDGTVNIVVDHLNCADIIAETLNMKVCAGGREFYSSYTLNHTRAGKEIRIGKSFVLKIRDNSIKINYSLAGNLKERIRDIEFMIAVVENLHICINDAVIPLSPTEEEIEAFHIDEAKKHLDYFKKIQEVLDQLGISEALDVNMLNDKSEQYLRMIMIALKYNQPILFKEKELPPVAPVSIANLKILLVFKPTEVEREFEIKNFFANPFSVTTEDQNGEIFETSQYTILNEDSFLNASNLNMTNVVNDLCAYSNCAHYVRVNLCVLEMLKAYDQNKNTILLESAKQITEWLLESDKSMEDIYVINLYQCYCRERKLSVMEKGKIYNLIEKYAKDSNMLAGLYLLLGEKEDAEKQIRLLPKEVQKNFKEYPIYNLMSK